MDGANGQRALAYPYPADTAAAAAAGVGAPTCDAAGPDGTCCLTLDLPSPPPLDTPSAAAAAYARATSPPSFGQLPPGAAAAAAGAARATTAAGVAAPPPAAPPPPTPSSAPLCPRTGAVCPAPSERKRELERKRRELISERLLELEAAVGLRPSDADRAGKRIDKEAVLKAALTMVRGHGEKLASMTVTAQRALQEAADLRNEKAELRADKAYLRRELDAVREEARRLRADNITLWKTCRAVGATGNPKLSHLFGGGGGGGGMPPEGQAVPAAPVAGAAVSPPVAATATAASLSTADAGAHRDVLGGAPHALVSADVAAAATAALDGLFTGRFGVAGAAGSASGEDPATAAAAMDTIAQFFKDDLGAVDLPHLDTKEDPMSADVAHCP